MTPMHRLAALVLLAAALALALVIAGCSGHPLQCHGVVFAAGGPIHYDTDKGSSCYAAICDTYDQFVLHLDNRGFQRVDLMVPYHTVDWSTAGNAGYADYNDDRHDATGSWLDGIDGDTFSLSFDAGALTGVISGEFEMVRR